MPESMSKRLKRLEQRVNRVAPGKRQLFFLNVPRSEYEAAMAILRELPVVTSADFEDRLEPFETQLEPARPKSQEQRPDEDESATAALIPDEFSDAARLKHLRDLSNDKDYRNRW